MIAVPPLVRLASQDGPRSKTLLTMVSNDLKQMGTGAMRLDGDTYFVGLENLNNGFGISTDRAVARISSIGSMSCARFGNFDGFTLSIYQQLAVGIDEGLSPYIKPQKPTRF